MVYPADAGTASYQFATSNLPRRKYGCRPECVTCHMSLTLIMLVSFIVQGINKWYRYYLWLVVQRVGWFPLVMTPIKLWGPFISSLFPIFFGGVLLMKIDWCILCYERGGGWGENVDIWGLSFINTLSTISFDRFDF